MMVNVDPNYRWGILYDTFWILPDEIKNEIAPLIMLIRNEAVAINDEDEVEQNKNRTRWFRLASSYVLDKTERLLQAHRYIIRDQGERVTLEDWRKLEGVAIEDQVDQG